MFLVLKLAHLACASIWDRRMRALSGDVEGSVATGADSHASRAYYLQKHYPFFAAVLYYTIANALKATVAINDHERGSIASVETA